MKWYRTDLHIHTILSPCGDLSMSPTAIAEKVNEMKLDIIAITDHNTVANYPAYRSVIEKSGVKVICGCEIQTSEEIHLIALFPTWNLANEFSGKLYDSLLPIENDPEFFGDQVIINENEEILGFESRALINSSMWSYEETISNVLDFEGFCFPAHIDAHSFSVIGQLGFIPAEPVMPCLGVTAKCDLLQLKSSIINSSEFNFVRNSDAHYVKDIGSGYSEFYLEEPNFAELVLAMKNQNGRKIKTK